MFTVQDLNLQVLYNYCTPSIFWENVGNEKAKVFAMLKQAKTTQDLQKIVNQYI